LRSVKGSATRIGTCNHRPGGCVRNTRPWRTVSLPEVARILFQYMRQKAENEKSRRDLIGFRSPESLSVGPPSLSIVRLPIAGLLECCLKRISNVGAEIDRLVVREDVFFARTKRRLILGDVILGLEVRDEAENPFWIFVPLSSWISRLATGLGWCPRSSRGLLR
jgi:hypothetical protein